MSARQETDFELDAMTRTRLHLAGQIAAGLVSNHRHTECRDWENEACRIAARMAEKLILLTVSGGI